MKSSIYRHVFALTLARRNFHEAITYQLTSIEVKALVDELSALAKEYRFRLSFIYLPPRDQEGPMDVFRPIIEAAGIPLLDVETIPKWRQTDSSKLFLHNDPCHLAPLGHEVVADILFEDEVRILNIEMAPILLLN